VHDRKEVCAHMPIGSIHKVCGSEHYFALPGSIFDVQPFPIQQLAGDRFAFKLRDPTPVRRIVKLRYRSLAWNATGVIICAIEAHGEELTTGEPLRQRRTRIPRKERKSAR